MRTPALSWNEAERWTEGISFEQDNYVKVLEDRLRTIVRDPTIRLAIYIASPSLHERLGPWLEARDGPSVSRVVPAVARYVMRMAGRATPFGLFAGSAVGHVGPLTRLTVPARRETIRHSRFDFEVVQRLAEFIQRNVRPHLTYFAPSDIYRRRHSIRYVTPPNSGLSRSYNLMEVELSEAVKLVVSFLRTNGGALASEICDHIRSKIDDIEPGDVQRFVDQLIEAGLMSNELGPPATGADALSSVRVKLRQSKSVHRVVTAIDEAQSDLSSIDTADADVTSSLYERARNHLNVLEPSKPSRSSFHVDLYKPTPDLMLGEEVVKEIIDGVELLRRLDAGRPPYLQNFADRFQQRYGELEVPLLEALDPTSGLSFEDDELAGAIPLFEGLTLQSSATGQGRWSGRDAILLQELHDVWRSGAVEMALSDRILAALPTDSAIPVPISCSALISLAAASNEAIQRQEYRLLLKAVFGRSSAALLGRFCLGNREISEQVSIALRREEEWEPEAIHAEIAYLPHGRAGNVVNRPLLREYEIDIFGGSGADRRQRIALSDLLVCVRNGRFRLISLKHNNKLVVPHFTCAHAPSMRDPLHYRFLVSLVESRSPHIKFSWGPLRTAPFLPRVTRGRLVLTTAHWNIPARRLEALNFTRGRERSAKLRKLRDELQLPRYVTLQQGDQNLPIDMENALSVDSFLAIVRRHATVTLTEMYPLPELLCAEGVEGRYVSELIVPLHRRPVYYDSGAASSRSPRLEDVQCENNRWLFAKVYCPRTEADKLLSATILPLVTEFRKQQLIERWHFVRYADPKSHIRLRLRGSRPKLYHRVLPRLIESLRRPDTIPPRLVLDTYLPEYIRYGGRDGLEVAERIFESDSWAASSLLKEYLGQEEARWQLALLGVHTFLEAAGYNIGEREEFIQRTTHYQRELNKRAPSDPELGLKYRKMRPVLESLLKAPSVIYPDGVRILDKRSEALRPLISELYLLESKGKLSNSVADIIRSCLHMWQNRMFSHEPNVQEIVVNAMLARCYQSVLARTQAK
jgi:thiopeptide-type bacteriocin biosynthesis protein